MILRVNRNYFLKHHQTAIIFNGDMLFCGGGFAGLLSEFFRIISMAFGFNGSYTRRIKLGLHIKRARDSGPSRRPECGYPSLLLSLPVV